jgi:hypothetical protein
MDMGGLAADISPEEVSKWIHGMVQDGLFF